MPVVLEPGTVFGVSGKTRAKFSFKVIDVFDPARTWRSALMVLPLFSMALFSDAGAWAALGCSVAWFALLAFRDAKRRTGVLLRFKSCMVQDLEIDETAALAQVWVESGDVARLDRGLRRHSPSPLQPGSRVVPLLFGSPSGRTIWFESGRPIELSAEELRGALSVVLSGEDLTCELLVTGRSGEKPKPRGVLVSSSNGVLQSWDEVELSVLA